MNTQNNNPSNEKEGKPAHIMFVGNGRDDTLKGSVHFFNIAGAGDYTLCGVTLDFDSSTAGDWEKTTKPVNCRRCADIVRLCKSKSLSEITKGELKD